MPFFQLSDTKYIIIENDIDFILLFYCLFVFLIIKLIHSQKNVVHSIKESPLELSPTGPLCDGAKGVARGVRLAGWACFSQ